MTARIPLALICAALLLTLSLPLAAAPMHSQFLPPDDLSQTQVYLSLVPGSTFRACRGGRRTRRTG